MAEAYRSLPITSDIPPNDAFPQAKTAAAKAIEIDESLAEPHASLTFVRFSYDWDWAGAKRAAARALQLNPNSAFAHIACAHLLSDLGRHEDALVEAEHARQLEPVSLIMNALNGAVLYYAGRWNEAVERLQKALDLETRFWVARLFLGKVFTEQKHYHEALAQFAIARKSSRHNSETIAMIGYVRALMGEAAEARGILKELKALARRRYIPPVNIAVVHLGLNEPEEAFAWLDRAYQERDVPLSFLKVDPKWLLWHGDLRMSALLTRLGLGAIGACWFAGNVAGSRDLANDARHAWISTYRARSAPLLSDRAEADRSSARSFSRGATGRGNLSLRRIWGG